MKKNNIYILLAILAVLIIIAYFLTSDRGSKSTSNKAVDEKLFVIDSMAVDKLEIEYQKENIVLQKNNNNWKIISPVNYQANEQFVNQAIFSLKNYKISSIVSNKPEMKDKYGFGDTSYTRIKVYQGDALQADILIGNNGPGQGQSYIKKPDADNIYLADDMYQGNLVKRDLKEWRTLVIVSIPQQMINSIEVITPKEKYTIVKDSVKLFTIGGDSLTASSRDGLMNMLQSLNTQSFKDTTIAEISNPEYYMKIDWGQVTELKFKRYFEGDNPPSRYYLKVSGINMIFDVDENFIKMLFKTKTELTGK